MNAVQLSDLYDRLKLERDKIVLMDGWLGKIQRKYFKLIDQDIELSLKTKYMPLYRVAIKNFNHMVDFYVKHE